ncbi:hypothetical protein BKA56DRAFT_611505 [Ilyonectria sp. MPI-CAGE-AT-0026]|nr:hypothetical protein BKA56DRAFT_611505 [Ilyonectria sp. MPI-CAGE-AT-0026]
MPVDDLESGGSTRPPSSIAAAGSFVDADAPIQLDDDNITEWVINHHAPNLIEELDEPNQSNLSASWTSLYQGLRALGNGSSKTSQQNGGPDQSRLGQNRRRLRISFAELQRMRIRQLQCELTKDVIQMRCDGTNPPEWETRLKEYTQALQDHDYMTKCSQRPRDPFLVTGEYTVDDYVLTSMATSRNGLQREKLRRVASQHVWEKPDEFSTICGTRNENERMAQLNDFQRRLLAAAIGGVFLIGPMWVMVLVNSSLTSLLVTTFSVTFFGLVMASSLKDHKDVTASTAAYAAVLVVFVGTNSSANS